MPDNINWDKILSKDNKSKEELTYEELHILEEYEKSKHEEELYMHEFPNSKLLSS